MYYKLNEKVQLRGWKLLPYALVVQGRRMPIFIGKQEMQALHYCTGTIDTSLPFIPKTVRDLLPQLEQHGVIRACEPGDAIRGLPFEEKN